MVAFHSVPLDACLPAGGHPTIAIMMISNTNRWSIKICPNLMKMETKAGKAFLLRAGGGNGFQLK